MQQTIGQQHLGSHAHVNRKGMVVAEGPNMEGLQRVGPLRAIPDTLRQLGKNPVTIISKTGIRPDILDNPENTITFTDTGKLLQACVTAAKCPHFGLLVGQQTGIADLGAVGQLMRHAPSVGRAIQDLCINQQRYVNGSVIYLRTQGQSAIWGYGIHHPNMRAIEQAYDLVTAMGLNIMRELAGLAPDQIRLARRAPDNVRPYLQVFGRSPVFDAEQTALVFSSKSLKQPVRNANSRVRADVAKYVANYWLTTQPTTRDRVVRILRARSISGDATLGAVARDLRFQTRTLNRRLREENTSFRDLRNLARLEIARQLLTGTRMRVTDIASALSYADPSVFTRAFKKWSGKSPEAWRKLAWRNVAAAAEEG